MSEPDQTGRLPLSAATLAVAVTAVWGFNFVVIKAGVAEVPPLLLAAFRFAFSAVPALLFVKRPAASWAQLAAYGLLLGVGQFGLLFTSMKLGASAGLTSLTLQSQAFFTVLLAAAFHGERPRKASIAGMAIAAAGLALLAAAKGSGSADFPVHLLAMTVASAFFWAAANIVARGMKGTSGLALMVWSSLFSPLPLFALSFFLEGPAAIGEALISLSIMSVGALAYLVILATLFGYGAWNHLIMKFGASRIAPFSLLVPVFGLASGALVLGEALGSADALASALLLAGLVVHVAGSLGSRKRPG